jgi:hypothetical protein
MESRELRGSCVGAAKQRNEGAPVTEIACDKDGDDGLAE